ncbi:MAG: rhomboid family intramembrane serine protease [Desulfovibrionaceae bacterium]|jgi:membrane associated rhomboid family serine protease|nr:rhomboid family intramembrane serine protease [Desulfovibrionaceae bacterium]
MIPLRDSIPNVHRPVAVYAIIALNALVFLWSRTLTDPQFIHLLHLYGVVPRRFLDPAWALAMGYPPGGSFSFVSYMFLHGGWLHIILNMWMLWIFADNIEDVMGPWRFTVFYLTCGLAALLTHMVFNPRADMPVVGASGAISGVLGAYFLLYPHARVLTLIPIFIFPLIIEIPAILFLGFWFVSQIFPAVSSLGTQTDIAWWAHAGGFVAGIVLLPLFRHKDRCYYCRRPTGDPRAGR